MYTAGQGQVKALIGMMNVCDSFRTIRTMQRSVVLFDWQKIKDTNIYMKVCKLKMASQYNDQSKIEKHKQ